MCIRDRYRALAKFVVLPWLGIAMCILNITSALGAALLYPASSFKRYYIFECRHLLSSHCLIANQTCVSLLKVDDFRLDMSARKKGVCGHSRSSAYVRITLRLLYTLKTTILCIFLEKAIEHAQLDGERALLRVCWRFVTRWHAQVVSHFDITRTPQTTVVGNVHYFLHAVEGGRWK